MRFIEEARTLAALDQPNIVRVHSVFEENATAYMVMAYELGDTRDDIAKFARLDDEQVLLLFIHPLLDALEHMHAAGFVHRDIKPTNIVVRPDGSPVLLDFDSARLALGGETRTLTSVVSSVYAPYEQYHSKRGNQGPWTDLYGLGATLYAVINRGRGPLDAIARGNARIEGTPDPMQAASALGAGRFSNEILSASDAALGFTPNERPQDTAQFRALLPSTNDLAGLSAFNGAPTVVGVSALGGSPLTTPASLRASAESSSGSPSGMPTRSSPESSPRPSAELPTGLPAQLASDAVTELPNQGASARASASSPTKGLAAPVPRRRWLNWTSGIAVMLLAGSTAFYALETGEEPPETPVKPTIPVP
jgi:serine/threonine protein kinase